jgi:hypothetical protein
MTKYWHCFGSGFMPLDRSNMTLSGQPRRNPRVEGEI